jgi:putative flippase GtrA
MNALQNLLASKPVILQLLRFAAIGVLNTALDFIILNFISKALGITSGFQLGTINVIGFGAAVVQSYYWNKHWTFDATQTADAVKNFVRLVVVGGIGAIGFLAVLAGAQYNAQPLYYALVLAIFLIVEVIAWHGFGLGRSGSMVTSPASSQFVAFLVVSVIGLILNSALVGLVSGYLATSALANPDLLKNIAKIVATVASLVWNFFGYKPIVFKK